MKAVELEKRQNSEKDFYDQKFSGKGNENYYTLGFTSIIINRMIEKIGNIEDKKVLEFGCGKGWLTKILASMGAEVWAFDISKEAVNNTKAILERLDLKYKVNIEQMTAESLNYNDNMFDLIVGNAILHHVDLTTTIKEIKRVLKDNGKAYFMEPLGHNSLINLYRAVTPNLRSKDERPLRIEQFPIIKEIFPNFQHEEYYLTAILALMWHFLGMNRLMLTTRDKMHKLDELIMNAFPFVSKYCWYSLLMLEK